MRRTHVVRVTVLAFVLLAALFTPHAQAALRLSSSGDTDGTVERRTSYFYWSHGSDFAITYTTNQPLMSADFYSWSDSSASGNSLLFALVDIPISSLRGVSLVPGSARLHLCSTGAVSVSMSGYALRRGSIYAGYIPPMTDLGSWSGNSAGWYSVDVTSLLQSVVNAGHDWIGFEIRDHGTFYTSEDPGGRGPYIEIVGVPEPSSLVALGGGLIALAGLARRRK